LQNVPLRGVLPARIWDRRIWGRRCACLKGKVLRAGVLACHEARAAVGWHPASAGSATACCKCGEGMASASLCGCGSAEQTVRR
jgi:hypothetical protein